MLGHDPDIVWCPDCGRYYSKKAEHNCFGREVKTNRAQLEAWLGTWTVKEDA